MRNVRGKLGGGKSVMVVLRGRSERGELVLKLEKPTMVDGKRKLQTNWFYLIFRSEIRPKTFLEGCNKGELREWREETLQHKVFSARYEGKVELRVVCWNRRRVVTYDRHGNHTCGRGR